MNCLAGRWLARQLDLWKRTRRHPFSRTSQVPSQGHPKDHKPAKGLSQLAIDRTKFPRGWFSRRKDPLYNEQARQKDLR